MNSPERDRRPIAANVLRSGHKPDDAVPETAKRTWTPPTVTTFKVSDTQAIFPGPPGDGINNISNAG